MTPSEQAIEATKKWLNTIVIDLNFCPFAKREVIRDSIRYVTVDNQISDPVGHFLDELSHLDKHPETETSLLILNGDKLTFAQFLDLCDQCEWLIEQSGYSGHYQLATFHPDYVFDGETEASPSNYTNRSVYPILHILRESSLTRVLNTYSEPEQIPQNNIQTAEKLGLAYLQQALLKCASPSK